MDIGFGQALLLFGGLLAAVAALSGVMKGTVLSASSSASCCAATGARSPGP